MGIYSLNRTGISTIDESQIEADMRYDGIQGCYEQMLDMEVNRQTIFEAAISRDFLEASYVNEGNFEQVDALNEATAGSIFENIKTFLKKVWAKIKGIFESFIKRLDSVVMRDNKKYVEKYQKQVRVKDLSKMKYKEQTKKKAGFDTLSKLAEGVELKHEADIAVNSIAKGIGSTNFNKIKEALSDGEYEDHILKNIVLKAEYKSFDKDVHELCFEDEEEKDGLSGEKLTEIIQTLLAKSIVNDVKKKQTATNKYFATLISDIDKMTNTFLKAKSSDSDFETIKGRRYDHANDSSRTDHLGGPKQTYTSSKRGQEHYVQNAGTVQQAIHVIEAVHNKIIGAYLKELKFEISQCRKIFAKAVSYNPKSAKNEETEMYLEAVEECALYEAEALFDDSFSIEEIEY